MIVQMKSGGYPKGTWAGHPAPETSSSPERLRSLSCSILHSCKAPTGHSVGWGQDEDIPAVLGGPRRHQLGAGKPLPAIVVRGGGPMCTPRDVYPTGGAPRSVSANAGCVNSVTLPSQRLRRQLSLPGPVSPCSWGSTLLFAVGASGDSLAACWPVLPSPRQSSRVLLTTGRGRELVSL